MDITYFLYVVVFLFALPYSDPLPLIHSPSSFLSLLSASVDLLSPNVAYIFFTLSGSGVIFILVHIPSVPKISIDTGCEREIAGSASTCSICHETGGFSTYQRNRRRWGGKCNACVSRAPTVQLQGSGCLCFCRMEVFSRTQQDKPSGQRRCNQCAQAALRRSQTLRRRPGDVDWVCAEWDLGGWWPLWYI